MDNKPVQPLSSPITPSPMPETPQSTKSSYHPHIIGFITLIVIFGLGYFFGTKQLNHSEPVPSPQVSASPVISSDSMTNWKTYTSSLGYTIQYPSTWFAAPDPGIVRSDIIYDKKDFLDIRSGTNLVEKNKLQTYDAIAIQQLTFANLDMVPTSTLQQIIQKMNGQSSKVIEEKNLQINKIQAVVRKVEIQKELFIQTYIPYADGVYVVSSSLQGKQSEELENTFDQILSTFKFLDEQTSGPSDWKTYNNNTYQFKFRFPSNLSIGGNDEGTLLYKYGQDGQNYYIAITHLDKLNVELDDPIGIKKETGDKIFEEKIADLVLDGKHASKFKTEVLPGSQTDAASGYFVGIKTNKGFLLITINSLTEEDNKIFDQILSTFKFTE